MGSFIRDNFLLHTNTARQLYHNIAAKLPILDYHCHVSPKQIYTDRHFSNITQLWLEGDHYKWRLMRSNGVSEAYITGQAEDWEKFLKFAQTLPKAIGNPMYHWCHLELKNYFGWGGVLNGDTAREVWQHTQKMLAQQDMGVRGLIQKSNVRFIGTTDDPTDDLQWHLKLAQDNTFCPRVYPTFRPDKALNADMEGWKDYIEKLSAVCGFPITDFASLKSALADRIAYFAANGCRASDHGLAYIPFCPATEKELDAIVKEGLSRQPVCQQDADKLRTALLVFCSEQYVRQDMVMQLHFRCLRNLNTAMYRLLGPDTGFDCIGTRTGADALAQLLDTLYSAGTLPRTILYSLHSQDNAFLQTLMGSFQESPFPGKLQHGSAWWFHDHHAGIHEHLTSLANLGLLGNFIGMLTDSRSFLSYARHEYFRRILCDMIGTWVEQGQYPHAEPQLRQIIEGICHDNAKAYFRL